jgi:hypothetical protein
LKLLRFDVGSVLMINYPTTSPHMTQDWHPAVIIGTPRNVGRPRFREALYQIVPTTSWKDTDEFERFTKNTSLYPIIYSRDGGLKKTSVILIDQIMSIDLNHFISLGNNFKKAALLGVLTKAEMQVIMDCINHYFQSQGLEHLD